MTRTANAILVVSLIVTVHGAASAKVSFQREIRPILSDSCFLCHGPDKARRMMGLRLDTREGAFSKRGSGAVIVPGKPQASLLYQRVTAAQPEKVMPPVSSHKKLTPEQKDTLKRWIEEGANWEEHWAFQAPARRELPAVQNGSWVRNPIDRFVLARLEAKGLTPAAEAGKRTLIRRVTLDLTGLPPKPEDVEAFVADQSPDAYEKLVDRLMATPQWGEHRARYWLDAARYGDTHGIHIDNYREIWPYRDWVIRAFNANMPFDRFTTEQIAGDLLPNPTLEQRIATGFQRCNVTTNEAGVIIDEVEAIYAKDRADTIGAVYMGLTVGCATCHDHKFDPIQQKDFYALTAFFRNSTQHAMDGNISDTPPIVVVPAAADRARWEAIAAQEKSLREELARVRACLAAPESGPQHTPDELMSLTIDGAIRLTTPDGAQALPFSEGLALGASPWPGHAALHFGSKSSVELPNLSAIDTNRPFTVSAWFQFPKGEEYFNIAAQNEVIEKNRGWMFFVSGRLPGVRFYGDEGKQVEIRAGHLDQVVSGAWYHIAFSYDGTGEALGVRMYMNGREVRTQRTSTAVIKGSIHTGAPLKLGNPTRPLDGSVADFRVFGTALTPEEIALLNPGDPAALARFVQMHQDPSARSLQGQLRDLEMERRAVRRRGAVSLVMEERTDQAPYAHVLFRGAYDAPRARVEANTPSVLPPMTSDMPRNRAGLAKWIVDPGNPLTARVTVNRFWQELFGDGIVKTSEDFGSQGQAPSNPELLDWLALEFRDSWDVKKFFRLMVTSSTYRQAATATPEKLEKDPDNRLLSRGPRFRLEGEMVRDYALAVSGLLVPEIGGPSVRPYQPDGVWETVAMTGSDTQHYKQDTGDKLYRRSLYWFWKRSAPPASMEIFNAPTRETCTVRRERTNTPLQALVTMNDPQFVEAARALAGRALQASGSDVDRQFDFIAARLMARPLSEQERAIIRGSYKEFLRHYDTKPADAAALVKTGETKPPENVSAVELAALTMVANQMLNLDEVLTK
ncbi:MAG TPA: DUF1553 domain-containing protein [Paludibaculum sp.]|jgi:hypothetical protein